MAPSTKCSSGRRKVTDAGASICPYSSIITGPIAVSACRSFSTDMGAAP